MNNLASRRLLQATVATLSLVPIGAGGAVVFGGVAVLLDGRPAPVDLDSHGRYLSGLLLGLGLVFLSTVPWIERRTGMVRVAGGIVVVGGIGRLLSLLLVGPPSAMNLAALAIELVAVPLLILWQAVVARAASAARGS